MLLQHAEHGVPRVPSRHCMSTPEECSSKRSLTPRSCCHALPLPCRAPRAQTMSAQRALAAQLRQFLRHDFNPAHLSLLAAHTQRLLLAAGALGPAPGSGGSGGSASGGSGGGSGCAPAAGSASRLNSRPLPSSEEAAAEGLLGRGALLGLTLSEAAGVGREEWAQLVTAAAESLVAGGRWPGGSIQAPALAAESAQPPDVSHASCGTAAAAAAPVADPCAAAGEALPRLVPALAAAHRALQYAAVAAWALGGGVGPRSRYLAKLCEAIEGRLGRLEGLLGGMPEAGAAVQVGLQVQGHVGGEGWAVQVGLRVQGHVGGEGRACLKRELGAGLG